MTGGHGCKLARLQAPSDCDVYVPSQACMTCSYSCAVLLLRSLLHGRGATGKLVHATGALADAASTMLQVKNALPQALQLSFDTRIKSRSSAALWRTYRLVTT